MDSSGCIYQLRLAQIAKQHCDFDQLLWDLRARNGTGSIRERWIGASWIIELVSSAKRDGKPFRHVHHFITTMRTSTQALLRLGRQRWAIDNESVIQALERD
jgi:hypothetical protein